MDTSSASRRSIIINSFRVKSRQPTADIQVRFHFQQLSELLRALIANLQIVFKRIASAFFESNQLSVLLLSIRQALMIFINRHSCPAITYI